MGSDFSGEHLNELLAALSLATDLANGNPLESGLKLGFLSLNLAKEAGVGDDDLEIIYYASLLRSVACTSFSHEEAKLLGGDDIAFRSVYTPADSNNTREILKLTFGQLARNSPLKIRIRAVANGVLNGKTIFRNMAATHCEVASQFVKRLGLPAAIAICLAGNFERWDGKGAPARLKGEAIPLASRIINLAYLAVILEPKIGLAAVKDILEKRAGSQIDPQLSVLFSAKADTIFAAMKQLDLWENAKQFRPRQNAFVAGYGTIAEVFADFTDLKSIYTIGHSRRVAALAGRTAAYLQLPPTDIENLRLAALLHDIGGVSVATGVWEKKGPLNVVEREAVEQHAYYTAKILEKSSYFGNIAGLAGAHHEKLNGKGYPRKIPAAALTLPARILSAADKYAALREDRAYRLARNFSEAAEILNEEVKKGELDRNVVQAILSIESDAKNKKRSVWPGGLSDREIQVLNLMVKGMSNKKIGAALKISPRTAGHHIIHIYDKIGVATRAGAVLFAVENNLTEK